MLTAMMVRDCLCSFLEGSLGGAVCRCSIYPSGIPTADICDNSGDGHGEAKISITSIFDSRQFPFQIQDANCRDSFTVLEITQTVWRCAPMVGDDGELPDVEDVDLSTAILLDDARAMRCAIKCCLDTPLVQVGNWTLLGASGGCIGGQLVSLVGVDSESCLEEASS